MELLLRGEQPVELSGATEGGRRGEDIQYSRRDSGRRMDGRESGLPAHTQGGRSGPFRGLRLRQAVEAEEADAEV